ncbi:unnamed protein product [Parnassius apollo]|uniref:(apollo) hypothetical protein n=1 Tax=Parnassius apollo TaxID=110799 RepID=A0A8S3XT63_PARAO|nr:unnamed protein product [Parnassius apollo]
MNFSVFDMEDKQSSIYKANINYEENHSSEDEDDEDPEYGEVGLPPVFLSRSETMFLGEEADEVPPTGM